MFILPLFILELRYFYSKTLPLFSHPIIFLLRKTERNGKVLNYLMS